ncbi:MAG: hypothetical protein IJN34_04600 [Clostridia bacterium]|nr:hypothetical protein [Clostridia bacterium]
MMKKPIFYTELSYALGMVLIAFAAALTAKADFGMSMVMAPPYILHLKLSEIFPWFTFGVSSYAFQGVLVLLTILLVGRFKWGYLFSFVTAVVHGFILDGMVWLVDFLPTHALWMRLIYFAVGASVCSFAVALFFHTYISPEAFELMVKELAEKWKFPIDRVKTAYDCISLLLSVALSFGFFGWGAMNGIGWGTLVCALVNGFLIGRFGKLLEKHFEFRDRFPLKKYFER